MKLNLVIQNMMKHAGLLAFTLGALTVLQPTAQAHDQVPFRASYNLELQMIVDPPFGHISSTGEAIATHLGRAKAHSVEETVNLLTGEGVATHQFTAPNGDSILIEFRFTAIPTSETLYAVTGRWQIVDGTGGFGGASGSGTYTGRVQFTAPTAATGDFKMEGTISSPGSLK
jgi:hypothetical protein